jgi:hypothetical protein
MAHCMPYVPRQSPPPRRNHLLIDIIIAVTAARAGAALWSADADLERLTGVMDDLTLRYQRPG